jgi:hypothetical protein
MSAAAGSSCAMAKSLKLKTGCCRRLLKELRSYHSEIERESAKKIRMKDAGEDPHNLKQQVIVPTQIVQNLPCSCLCSSCLLPWRSGECGS